MAKKVRQKGSGGLRHDAKKNLWIATGSVTVNGVRHRPSASAPGPKSGKEATRAKEAALEGLKVKLAELNKSIETGVTTPKNYSLAQCAYDWCDYMDALPAHAKNKIEEKSIAKKRGQIANHVEKTPIGRKPLKKITATEAQEFFDKLGHHLGERALLMLKSTLTRAVARAEKADLIERNVFALIEVNVYTEGRPSDAMTIGQARAFLRAAEGHWSYPLLLTALTLALRPGEVCAVRRKDVDLDKGVLRVETALSGHVKTADSRRALAIPAPLLDVLRPLKAGDEDGRLFTRPDGNGISLQTGTYWMRKFLAEANVGGTWHMHELRHTGASIMRANGCTQAEVSEVLGHVIGSRVTRGYLHEVTETVISHHVEPMTTFLGGTTETVTTVLRAV